MNVIEELAHNGLAGRGQVRRGSLLFGAANRGLCALKGLFRFLRNLARELSDENAYQRHLAWHRRIPSREEWQAFSDARLKRKYQNGKCC